jgi:hypothetical protein
MKLKSLFAAVVVTLLLASCGKKPADILSKGAWKLSALDTKGINLPDSMKTVFLSNSSFEFKKDGSYAVSMGSTSDAGTYTIDKDGKTMSAKSSKGAPDATYTLLEVTPEKVVMEDATAKYTVVPK